MAKEKEETVKIELELPKSEVSIEAPEASQKKEKATEKEEQEKQLTGYKPFEIAKAPVEPPKPKDKKGPNVHQKRVVIFGFGLAAASLILWPIFSFWIFVAVACAAALVVAYGTFIKI